MGGEVRPVALGVSVEPRLQVQTAIFRFRSSRPFDPGRRLRRKRIFPGQVSEQHGNRWGLIFKE